MSSITNPSAQNEQANMTMRDAWTHASPYIAPPVAAGLSVIPVSYGFNIKSALQLGNPFPRMSFSEILRGGIAMSPTVGGIVGTQMIAQNMAQKGLKQISGGKDEDRASFAQTFIASAIVGLVSAPGLAVFNGQTAGKKVKDSLRELSPKQAMMITARETSFLFSLAASGPISDYMEKKCGENKIVGYASTFISGSIGSIVGHPFDTALTLDQHKMKMRNFRHLMQGGGAKALTVGGFAICYKAICSSMQK